MANLIIEAVPAEPDRCGHRNEHQHPKYRRSPRQRHRHQHRGQQPAPGAAFRPRPASWRPSSSAAISLLVAAVWPPSAIPTRSKSLACGRSRHPGLIGEAEVFAGLTPICPRRLRDRRDCRRSSPRVRGRAPPPRSRPLRRDAELNLARILVAATDVFAEDGYEASMEQIADRAGLGVGTLYRRFPSKADLVEPCRGGGQRGPGRSPSRPGGELPRGWGVRASCAAAWRRPSCWRVIASKAPGIGEAPRSGCFGSRLSSTSFSSGPGWQMPSGGMWSSATWPWP